MSIGVGYKYRDQKIKCELCGRSFRTPQGLAGHARLKHDVILPSVGGNRGDVGLPGDPNPVSVYDVPIPGAPPMGSLEDLEAEVKRLELQAKINKLRSVTDPIPQSLDAAEQIGLGKMMPEVSGALQSRAFGLGPQPVDPITSVINSPNLPHLISLLKEVMNRPAPAPSNGDNPFKVLQDIGIDVGSLILQKAAPGGLRVGDVDLTGLPLDASAVSALIEAQSRMASDAQRRELWNEGIKAVAGFAGPAKDLAKGILQQRGRPVSSSMTNPGVMAASEDPQPLIGTLIPCGSCNTPLKVTGDHNSGDQITCSECGAVWDLSFDEGGEPAE